MDQADLDNQLAKKDQKIPRSETTPKGLLKLVAAYTRQLLAIQMVRQISSFGIVETFANC